MSNARNPRSHPNPNLYPVPSVGDLADVSAEFPSDGDTLIWDAATNRYINGAGGGGGVPSRSTISPTTASLANLATEVGTFSLPTGMGSAQLATLQADRACWVRFYANAAARSADSTRVITTDPTPGRGVLGEFIFALADTFEVAPPVWLYNNDGTVAEDIYYSVKNLSGATAAVALTLTILADGTI